MKQTLAQSLAAHAKNDIGFRKRVIAGPLLVVNSGMNRDILCSRVAYCSVAV